MESISERLDRIESLLLSQKVVFNLDELHKYTGLSKSYLYKLTSNGGIPCYTPKGKKLYFKRSEIDNWLLRNPKQTKEDIESSTSTYVALNRI